MKLFFTQMDPPPSEILETLHKKGWEPIHLPMRREHIDGFKPINASGLEAVLITSKRGVRWLLQGPRIPTQVAVVGEASAALLPHELRLFPDAAANAMELAQQLRARFPKGSRFLWLRGEKAKDTLRNQLQDYQVDEQIVYKTLKIPQKMSTLPASSMVYFQAPSTVVDFRECFGQKPTWIGAIGPSTEAALRAVGWKAHFQPSRPENIYFAEELPSPSTMAAMN